MQLSSMSPSAKNALITARCLTVALTASLVARADETSTPRALAPSTAVSDTSAAEPNADKPLAAASSAENRPTATPADVANWIAELDSNRYLVREQATLRLAEAGAIALDSLLVAANGAAPEPADRAVWILRRVSQGKDRPLRRQALERLVQVKHRPQVVAAASMALAEIRHDEAVDAIQRLGGRYVANESMVRYGPYVTPRVELDRNWRGGDAGLAHLRDLILVRQVIVIGAPISVEGLSHLQEVNGLMDLWLYGTKLEEADVAMVRTLLPQVNIDHRRGALLGVGSNSPDGMGPAVVGMVTPKSVAEAAGIKPGDIIQKFQNQPVANFKALTTMIGQQQAGDEVTIHVLRGEQTIEFTVKLGEWQVSE